MNMTRMCEKCGKSFTLADAIMEYDSFADGTSYMENYAGEICGECAIDELEDAWREADQYQ